MGFKLIYFLNFIMKRFMVLLSCCRFLNKVGGFMVYDDLILLILYIVKRNLKLVAVISFE